MTRRKQLAAEAFERLWSIWIIKSTTSEQPRLRLHDAIIVPVITSVVKEAGHWHHIYPQQISSNALYEICEYGPMSLSTIKTRWGLCVPVMRMAHDTHAQIAMYDYIAPTYSNGVATYDTTTHTRQRYVWSQETYPLQAIFTTFKNNCVKQKSMA